MSRLRSRRGQDQDCHEGVQDGQRDQPEDSDAVQTREEFTSPLWDAARAVEATTLSLMTGEKAAALSRNMGELTHVGREVYKEVNWHREDKSQGEGGGADAQYGPVGQEGCRAAVTEEVLETSRMKVTYLGGHDTVESDVQREVTRGPHAGAE